MRFDLEIPAVNNIKLVFISEDDGNIPNSVAPLLYCGIDTKDMFPSDFVSIEPGFKPVESSIGGYSEFTGPIILNIKGDKFLLTNKMKYKQNGTYTPLFYKHVIDDTIKDEAIKIIDYYDVELSKDQYLTEQYNGQTYIYINKQEKVYFVSYTIGNKIHKDFLNLTPVYEEAGLNDITNGSPDDFHYIYMNGNVATNFNGQLYISYLSDTKLVRNVCGNIEDNWNIGVLNADFIDSKTGLRYWIPEFYMQNLSTDYRYKFIKNKKCRKIFGNYIQSQYPIAKEGISSLVIYVHDYYSNKLKYAFTGSEALVDTLCSDTIYYQKISSYNIDGMIYLPVEINEDDIVYASHFTDEQYYEYSGVNLNSNIFDTADYFVIYIRPNVPDTQSALGYAIIGNEIKDVSTSYFPTIEAFYDAVDNDQESDCYLSYTAAIVSVANILENAGLKLTDVSSEGGYIKDKKEVCAKDIDMAYSDIINGYITLPTNDAVIAQMDMQRLLEDGRFAIDENSNLNTFAQSFVGNVYKTLKKNLDASTFPIVEINASTILDGGYNLITHKYFTGD